MNRCLRTWPQGTLIAAVLFALGGFLSQAIATSNDSGIDGRVGTGQTAWTDQLLGEVVKYKSLADYGAIPGNFEPYIDQLLKVRASYQEGDQRGTFDTLNAFMVMLESRVGQIDPYAADALWDLCYRITPDQFHARDRHVRAKGHEELQKWEEFLRIMEEKASLSF